MSVTFRYSVSHDLPPAHALLMPSSIFTRLGWWNDIASNLAAKQSAHQQGDTGEELHSMDYLVCAYPQGGRDQEAAEVIQRLTMMSSMRTIIDKSPCRT